MRFNTSFKQSMMSPMNVFCVSVLFATSLWSEINGQSACTPTRVISLSLSLTQGLTWIPPFDTCNIGSYLVTIKKEGSPSYLFNVQSTSLNVSFLPVCENFEFSVVPISTNHVEGLESTITTRTPPTGLNLTVGQLNITQTGQNINLAWAMKSGAEKCVDEFRLVVWDENTVTPTDIYVQGTSSLVENVVPCMKYKFEIRAIIGALEEGEALYVNYTSRAVPPSPPTLAEITQEATSVNITWNLQSFEANRCPILELIADASPNFNTSFGLSDSPQRPPFVMTLRNLRPNTIYLCRILVVNRAGASSPLALAVQTQPAVGKNEEISSTTDDKKQLKELSNSYTFNKHSIRLETSDEVVRNKPFTY